MTDQAHGAHPTMHSPAIYRVRVIGRLDPAWSDRLEDMQVSESSTADGETVTALMGQLADQAALSGVLDTLYQLRLPILSVDWLEDGLHENGGLPE